MLINRKVQARLLKRNIRYSMIDGMFYAIMLGATIPYLGLYILRFNGPPELVNLITAVQPTVTCIFTLLGTAYANSFQRKKILLIPPSIAVRLLILVIAFVPFLPANIHAWAFFTLWGIFYIPSSYCGLTWSPMMCNIVPEEKQGRFFGVRNALTGFTTLLGTSFTGIALSRFPFLPAFTGTFIISFLCTAVSFYYLAKHVEPVDWEPGEDRTKVRSNNSRLFQLDLAGNLQPFLDPEYGRIFSLCCLAVFIFHIGYSMAIPLFTLRQIQQLGFSNSTVSTITILSGLTAFVGSYAGGYISDHWGFRYALLFSTTLALFPPLIWALSSRFIWLILASMLWGFSGNAYMICFSYMVLRMSPFKNRSRFVGMNTVIGNLAGALGPLISMLLVKFPNINIQGALICATAIMGAGVTIAYDLVRKTSI
ncbi:MAG TPA: MFS transporter [Bacillota bacterium]